jgi:hypothetical protein
VVPVAREKWDFAQVLPEDLYSIPESQFKTSQESDQAAAAAAATKVTKTKNQSKKWGPRLVEKRPSRRPHDGRSILKIAHDRKKKKSNLEVNTGMVKSKNPSHSNVAVDISSLADATWIQLGVDSKSELESIAEMSKCETNRASMFRDNCEICKASSSVTSKGDSIVGKEVEREGDGDPHTPPRNSDLPQMEDNSSSHGQWTVVVNKKKNIQT